MGHNTVSVRLQKREGKEGVFMQGRSTYTYFNTLLFAEKRLSPSKESGDYETGHIYIVLGRLKLL